MANVVSPKVYTLGASNVDCDMLDTLGMPVTLATEPVEDLVEFAGRSCYQSFHRPNPATEKVDDYIHHIIEMGHESVLEHTQFTFYITGVTRAFTHELIRHRHLSYSQLSQRFVNEENANIVMPPAILEQGGAGTEAYDTVVKNADKAFKRYRKLVDNLTEAGYKRKQAREAARAVLPNNVETRIVVTGNARAWRDMLKKRLDPAADAEIRQVSQMLLEELKKLGGAIFDDFD